MIDLTRLPLKKIYQAGMWARATFFPKPRRKATYYRVEKTEDEIERMLGKEHHTHDWEFSYAKRGEDINMRRPDHKDDEYEWYQNHVRGWKVEEGVHDLICHTELAPGDYLFGHLRGVNFSKEEGMHNLKAMLAEYKVPYEETEYNG